LATDLEPADPFPPSILQVYVQDANGAPLSGAEIRTFAMAKEGVRQVAKTDASGAAQVSYAPASYFSTLVLTSKTYGTNPNVIRRS